MATSTWGGGIDQTAVIGHAPEMRDWKPRDRASYPDIDPTARIEAYVTIDAGYEKATHIGARVWLMKACHVGHDAVIGEDSELAPHCSVGGYVVIGRGVKVGQGAIFKPNVVIGDGAVIGCGAVVIRDVPAGETWAGNPAKRIVRTEKGAERLGTFGVQSSTRPEPLRLSPMQGDGSGRKRRISPWPIDPETEPTACGMCGSTTRTRCGRMGCG
jgi:acetyltransferase-like isoleucine patch superfamily enzyme